MVTKTWNGANANWNVSADWSPSGEPGLLDTAIIGSGNVAMTNLVDSIAALTLGDDATLTVTNSKGLLVNLLPGLLNVSGTLTNTGTLNISAGGELLASSVSTGSIDNFASGAYGTINITGDVLYGASLLVGGPAGFGVTGAVEGNVNLIGNATIGFATGDITKIDTNSELTLDGSPGLVQTLLNVLTGNSLLTDLDSIAGALNLAGGSSIATTTALAIGADGAVNIGAGGSSLSVGGALTNAGDVTVGAGGTLTVGGGGFAQSAGQTDISGTLNASVSLGGGSFDIESGGSVTGAIAFTGPASLTLQSPQAAANVISGAAYGDTIEFANVAYAPGEFVTLQSTSGGVQTFALESANDSVLATLKVAGDFAANFFTVGDDGGAPELIADQKLAISGTVPGQEIADKQTDALFSGVTISNTRSSTEAMTLTVSLNSAANGTLSDVAGGAYDATTGIYTYVGDVAQVNTAAHDLVFTPTIAPGTSVTTSFVLHASDGIGAGITDSATTVNASSYLGGGRSLVLGGAPGYAVSIYDTDSDWDQVTASNGTVFVTNAQTSVSGGGDTIDLSGAASNQVGLYNTNGAWDAVSGDNGTIFLNTAQASVFGSDDLINLVGTTGNSLSLYQTNNGWDAVNADGGTIYLTDAQTNLVGGGATVDFIGTTGNAVSLYDTNQTYDVISGIDGGTGTIYMTGAQATVSGGGQSINLLGPAGNVVSFLDTTGNWDGVTGSNAALNLTNAQVSVTGGADAVYFLGSTGNAVSFYTAAGKTDTVNGSDGTIYLTNAQASVTGGDDTVLFRGTTGDVVNLYGTAGEWDAVAGVAGTINLNNAQASVSGGGQSMNLIGPSGNSVSLYATGGDWDNVAGSNATVYMTDAQASVSGGDDTINLLGTSGNQLSVYGTDDNWDLVAGSSATVNIVSAQASVFGSLDTITFSTGTGNATSLYNTIAGADTVEGSNGTVYLTSAQADVTGGNNTVYFSGGTGNVASLSSTAGFADALTGSNGTVNIASADASVSGSMDTIAFSGNSTASLVGSNDHLNFAQGIGGADVINGFGSTDAIQLSKMDFANFAAMSSHLSQSGANAVITLDASDKITLTNVTASSLTASQFSFV
jgi:hypothetical protein